MKKKQLCVKAAEILRCADLCTGKQFVVVFGQDYWNRHDHCIGMVLGGLYRIDDVVYSSSQAMRLVKGFVAKGAYTLSDLDYANVVAEIVRGNTSSLDGEFWCNDASLDCDNHPEMLLELGKTSDDLFEDVLTLAIRQGHEAIV